MNVSQKAEQNGQPLVYIIILNWNGKQDTIECLDSLQKITYRNSEICVVDNGSTDGSVAVLRKNFPDLKIIANKANVRFARGNNIGIEYALKQGAEYVLLLNNDTVVEPDFLSKLIEVADASQEAGLVGPKIYYYDAPDLIWSAGGRISFWKGKIAHRGLRRKDSDKFNEVARVDYLTACAVLARRAAIEKVGLLDASYYIYGEDADWCERMQRAGYKLLYVPGARVWHKISSASGGGMTSFKIVHKVKSNFMFFRKYARWYHWLTIPFCVSAETIWFLIKQIAQGNLRVLPALFKGFRAVFQKS